MELYIGSADMKIFQLSEVNTNVAYNKSPFGAELFFSISGFVNKKAFVEASFNPNTNEFSGKLLASTNSILSTDECVSLFISHDGLSHNSAYATVSNDTSVNMLLNLKYLSDQKNVTVKQFSISILSTLSFGPITLSKLKLHYNNSGDETTHNDVDKNSAVLSVGSSLHLLAVVLQSSGSFGLKLSFDCNVKSKDLNVFTEITQSSLFSLSLWPSGTSVA